jgi:hypothetical protein
MVNMTAGDFQFAPWVAVRPTGEFVVTWTSDGQDGSGYGVFARMFDAAAQPVTGEIAVNTTTTNEQLFSRIDLVDDGRFVIVWEGNAGTPHGDYGVFGRRFAADGSPAGPEFLVTVFPAGYQGYPDVAMDARGGFTVVWYSNTQDGNGLAVMARRYDTVATPLGGEFIVNISTIGTQSQQAVAGSPDGSFVVAWQGPGDGSGYGIFARRYVPSATLSGIKFESPGNTPVEGLTVFYDLDGDGIRDANEPTTVTDVNGQYTLRDLPGGSFAVVEQVPGGYAPLPGYGPSYGLTMLDGAFVVGYNYFNDRVLNIGGDRTANENSAVPFTANVFAPGTWSYLWLVNGVPVLGPSGPNFNFVPPDNGTYTVAVSVTDGVTTYVDTARVFAVNVLPDFTLAGAVSVPEGSPLLLDLMPVDAAGDVLFFEWFVDNVLDATKTSATATFSWPENGAHTVRVRVRDDDDPTWVERTIAVTVTNADPQSLSITPSANLAEGDAITLTGAFTDPGSLDTHTLAWMVKSPGGATVASGFGTQITWTPADNGAYVATFLVTDDDGGMTSTTSTITVTNVAPQAVVIAGLVSVYEAESADFGVSFTDAGTADTHTVAWQVRDAGNAVVASGSGMNFSWVPTFSGIYTVSATVTDDDGGATVATPVTLIVRNVVPRQVNAGPNVAGPENTAILLTGTWRDPGISYEEFAATWVVTDAINAVVATGDGATMSFVPPDDGVYTATMTVLNVLTGQSASASRMVTATNVAPTGVFVVPGTGTAGQPVAFVVNSPVDATGDLLAGLHYAFDFTNDGIFDVGTGTYAGSPNSSSTSFAYSNPGTYTARVRVLDKDGGATEYTGSVTIVSATPPTATIAINQPTLNSAKVGADALVLTATFDQAMNTSVAPAFSFPVENPGSAIVFASGTWTSATTYQAKYNLVDLDTQLANIDIRLTGGVDTNGLVQTTADLADAITIDTADPTVVSIVRADATPTASGAVHWTVTFSEPVAGVSTSHFALSGTGLAGASLVSVAGAGTTWTVTANTGADGTLGMDLASGSGIADSAANPLSGAPVAGPAYSVDKPQPVITGIVINGGATQRSRVLSVQVNFDSHVTFTGTAAAAFELRRQSDSALPALIASVDDSGTGTVVTLTFSGSTAVDSSSLADGRYTLTAFASKISNTFGSLDGNADGAGGDDYTLVGDTTNKLFRLFGDADGSGQVTSSDFLAFRLAFLSSSAAFDYNGSGSVDSSDFLAFRLRFLQSV